MTARLQKLVRPQFDVLEDRRAPATLTITPPGYSDPTGGNSIVLRITSIAEPGLRMAQAHTGGIVQWSLANAARSSDSTATFQASGTVTSVTFHGNHRLGPVEGTATQLGQFTGSIDARVTRLGADETATGTLTLTTQAGDSLVLSFNVVRERGADSFVGTWSVAGGSGRFADATGTGAMTLTPQPGLTAAFALDGSLNV